MKSRLSYTSIWDIIDSLLQFGGILYGPGVLDLLYPSKWEPYQEDNLIRVHYHSQAIEDIEMLDSIVFSLGYNRIVESTVGPYSKDKWYHTTYSTDLELPFPAPMIRISIRPFISYSMTIADSLCLIYNDDEKEYQFFYSGIYLWKDRYWKNIHSIDFMGYIRIRTLRHNRHLANGKRRVTYSGMSIDYDPNELCLPLSDIYVSYENDNSYLC